jgi:hypothetical protein
VTNAAYQNSGIIPRLRLVHAMEVDFLESGNTGTDLNTIRSHPLVARARNLFQADSVAFLVAHRNERLRHGLSDEQREPHTRVSNHPPTPSPFANVRSIT